MDFEDTPEEAAFRHEVTAWLAEQAAEYDLSRHGDITMEAAAGAGARVSSPEGGTWIRQGDVAKKAGWYGRDPYAGGDL